MIGSVTLSGGALLQFAGGQITTIANGGTLALEGVQAFVADAGQTASNSALSGLSAIDAGGKLDLQGSSDVATLGDLTNDGVIIVNAMGFASTTLIIGGVLTNIGSIKLGGVSLASNGDSSGTITLDSLVNTDGNGHLGHIEIQGGPDADDRSVLAVNAAAGLDPSYPGMLTGTVTLSGNALLEFGSGTIRTIAAKSTLGLNGTGAFVADAADTASSSALVGLTTVAGQLDLADFATVTTATTLASTGKISLGQNASLSVAALTNGAVVSLVDDSQLTATGRLANGPKGTIDISDSGVAAGSLVNQNVLDLTGSAHGTATLSLAQAATNAATGTINLDGNSTLDVREALTNNGKVTLKAGMVAIGGDLAGTGTVDFSNVSTIGVLRAAAIAATQTIAGFDAGDTIDLSGTVVSALAFKGTCCR